MFFTSPTSGHLDDEQIVRLLDGELSWLRRHVVSRHLEHCWQCRRRSDQFRAITGRFVELDASLANALEPVAFNLTLPTAASQPIRSAPVVALAAAGVLAALFFVRVSTPVKPAAAEVIGRSGIAEHKSLAAIPNPVIRQELKAETSAAQSAVRIVRAPEARLAREVWDDSGVREQFGSLYRAHGLDPSRPLSAANHSHWRESLSARRDEVREEGEYLFVRTRNTAPWHAGDIVDAELTVRRADWRPVAQEFTVLGAGSTSRYRIVETGWRVLPYDAETAAWFDVPRPSAPRHGVTASESLSELPLESATSSALDPVEAEIETLALLRKIGADRQEGAQVIREAARVRVVAYAGDAERQEFLRRSLASIDGVESEIHILEQGTAAPVLVAPAEPASAPILIDDLVRVTGSPVIATRVTAKELELIREAGAHLASAAALDSRFPPSVLARTSPRGRQKLDALALEYLASAREAWSEAESNLKLFESALGFAFPQPPQSVCPHWRETAAGARQAVLLDELLGRAFSFVGGGSIKDFSARSLRGEIAHTVAQLRGFFAEECSL